tara:strand:+ start:174 stop:485 length:312 start_codon:yes stop_codon:yes gene_type:complete
MTTVSVPNPDPIGDFEKKVRSKKNTNPYAKKTPAYDDGKYIGNLTQEEIRDYQEKQKEKKNTRSNTRTKFKASGGRVTLKNGGRVAKGCGAVMPDRRKKTKYF